MRASEAISQRRSIKRFTDQPVSREDMEKILNAAALAPNHHLTQPWRFYVLGPDARYAYGIALGNRKAKKIEDPAKAQTMRENVGNEHRALPGMIAVAVLQNENEEIREEDYAATMMAIQNLSLVAVENGFGTHIKTGAVMADPNARAAINARDGERIIALVNVGVPAEVPERKARDTSAKFTTWVP